MNIGKSNFLCIFRQEKNYFLKSENQNFLNSMSVLYFYIQTNKFHWKMDYIWEPNFPYHYVKCWKI